MTGLIVPCALILIPCEEGPTPYLFKSSSSVAMRYFLALLVISVTLFVGVGPVASQTNPADEENWGEPGDMLYPGDGGDFDGEQLDPVPPDPGEWPPRLDDLVKVAPPQVQGTHLRDQIRSIIPWVIFVRREIHRNPELGFREFRTSTLVARALQDMGYSVRTRVGRTGIVATLEGGRPGRTIVYRADMDALPIKELTGLPYASIRHTRISAPESRPAPWAMHACGHDMHVAVLLGAARILSSHRDALPGRLVFLVQPAEELGKGAQSMIEDGAFRDRRPDAILGLHVFQSLATGEVGFIRGTATANIDNVKIIAIGAGGHGAYPHLAIDPIVIGARIVLALQILTAREIDPHDPAVITVGSFRAGLRSNVIPSHAELRLTVRTLDEAVRKRLLRRITRTVKGISESAGAPAPVIVVGENPTPAGVNDPELSDECQLILESVVGTENVIEEPAAMGGEDFYRFSVVAPTFMFRLGVTPRDKLRRSENIPGIHSGKFVPDEDALPIGIEAVTRLLEHLLEPVFRASPGNSSFRRPGPPAGNDRFPRPRVSPEPSREP